LHTRGHAVRGTTRDPAHVAEIESAGADAFVADPDRIATIVPALDHVTVVCVLLGSATATPEALSELHGPRLEMLLRRLLDTTMHGVLYESRGSVPADLLAGGAELVRRGCTRFRIPYALLEADPNDHGAWLTNALAEVERLITSRAR
jgi:hypothetical protein